MVTIGKKEFIPRLSLILFDHKIPFHFQYKQFLIVIYFVMTINKSQGQSFKYVEIYLPRWVSQMDNCMFAILRVTTGKRLKILICNDDGDNSL